MLLNYKIVIELDRSVIFIRLVSIQSVENEHHHSKKYNSDCKATHVEIGSDLIEMKLSNS